MKNENEKTGRELELISYSLNLYNENNPEDLLDVFKIKIDDSLPFVEQFLVRTCLMLKTKFGTIDNYGDYIKSNSRKNLQAHIDLNPKFENFHIKNITEFTICSYYPTLIINDDVNEISNYIGMKSVYEDLYLEYLKNRIGISKLELDVMIKKYINSVFGILGGNNNLIRSNIDLNSITEKGRLIMSEIQNKFSNNFIYSDTDCIYFYNYDDIKDELSDYIETNYNYLRTCVDFYHSGIFLSKKRYILYDEDLNILIKKGIRDYNP